MLETDATRDWSVLVIGGAAAAGKTTTARAVAERYGVSVLPADAIWLALKAATNPVSHPELHYFDASGEDMQRLTVEDLCERHIKSAQAMDPLLEYYRWERWPVILEGAWITPAAATRWARQYAGVRAVFIHEPDVNQISETMAMRRGISPPTRRQKSSKVHWLFGNWLREQALAEGLPVVDAHPRETLADRVLASI